MGGWRFANDCATTLNVSGPTIINPRDHRVRLDTYRVLGKYQVRVEIAPLGETPGLLGDNFVRLPAMRNSGPQTQDYNMGNGDVLRLTMHGSTVTTECLNPRN